MHCSCLFRLSELYKLPELHVLSLSAVYSIFKNITWHRNYMLLSRKAANHGREFNVEKKRFIIGQLSAITYFHTKEEPCALQDLRNKDFHKLMKPSTFSYWRKSRGLPVIWQTRKSSNKILVIILEHSFKKQCIVNSFDSIGRDI